MISPSDPFLRRIADCNNWTPPGDRLALRLRGVPLGWADPALLPVLAALGVWPGSDGAIELPDAAALQALGPALAQAGFFRLRNEEFDILANRDGPSLGRIDRGALPAFGMLAAGVHVNGLVEMTDGPYLWVGRRAADKLLDPGKLDQLVGGGVTAGLTPLQTLVKEGEEECNLPLELARQAIKVGQITYTMQRTEGIRRDILHCYDLQLPRDWVPRPNDGEVEEFRLLPLGLVFETMRDTDDFKFNVNLVLIDLFLRRGLLDEASAHGRLLRAGLAGAL